MIHAPVVSTKDRILDAAEHLFAEKGFAETSLRDITAEAGANLAAVNYHFQSKEALIQAVLARRVGPVNAERVAMLDHFESVAAAQGRAVAVEDILRAFFAPVLQLLKEPAGARFARLFGRVYVEPGDLFERFFRSQLAAVAARFFTALERAVPQLSHTDRLWRMHFALGVMGHTIAGMHHFAAISGGVCDTADIDCLTARLISFITAGFSAPAIPGSKGESRCNGSC